MFLTFSVFVFLCFFFVNFLVGFQECAKTFVFRGNKPVQSQEVQQQLGLVSRDPRGGAGGTAARRFLLPVSECEFTFNAILDELQKDQWPVATDHRPQRCTGVALSVALALLESCAAQQSGRVLLFAGKKRRKAFKTITVNWDNC